jgi:O-antigen ligase
MFSSTLILAALFFPSRGHLRLEYVLVALVLVIIIAQKGFGPFARVRRELFFLGYLTISGLISIMVYNAGEGTFHYRDLFSVARYPVYGAVLAAAAISTRGISRSKKTLARMIGVSAIGVAIISLLQHYNPGNIDSLIRTLFPVAQAGSFEPEYGTLAAMRLTGTTGNPNWWGFTIVATFLLVIARVFVARGLSWLPIVVLLVPCLVLTGSRTAAVAALGGIVVILALSARVGALGAGRIALSTFVALFVIGWGAYYQLNLAADTSRFDIRNMGSLVMRFEVWTATLEEYQDDIILGRGPAKLERRYGFQDASSYAVRDNIYISFLAQYGVIGLVGFLGLCILQVVRLFALSRTCQADDRWWPIGLLGIMAAWLLFGATADSFFFVPSSNLFLILYGTALAVSLSESESPVDATGGLPARNGEIAPPLDPRSAPLR